MLDDAASTFISQAFQRDHAFRFGRRTVLSRDVAAAIGELRAEPGGVLQVRGSGTLIRWLLDQGLVDEIVLLTPPPRRS